MSIRGLLARFGLAYLVLLLGIAITLSLLGVKTNAGTNTAALLGAVMWACMAFGKRNGRYFTREEKPRAVLGMLAVDLALQAAFAVGVSLLAGAGALQMGPLLFSLLFIGVLHAVTVYFFVGLSGKQFAAAQKQKTDRGQA
ncbi:MAG: ABZJ_00895 family protein [Variovorax sp.]|nr:ABZJ_00895 family protein [Variovorax sp.]